MKLSTKPRRRNYLCAWDVLKLKKMKGDEYGARSIQREKNEKNLGVSSGDGDSKAGQIRTTKKGGAFKERVVRG